MTTLDWREFSRRNRARCESSRGFGHALDSWSRSDWLLAAGGEVGELAAALVDFARSATSPEPASPASNAALAKNLSDEIADVFISLDLAAQASGFTLHPNSRSVTAMLVSELAEHESMARRMGWGSAHWITPFVSAFGGACSTMIQIIRVRQGLGKFNKPGISIGKLEADFVVDLARSVCFLEHLANKCGIVFPDAIISKFEETSARIGYKELSS